MEIYQVSGQEWAQANVEGMGLYGEQMLCETDLML
jgi:hypothetical protein